MDGTYLFLAEMLITLGVVIGIGLFELRRVNKKLRARDQARAQARDAPPSNDDAP